MSFFKIIYQLGIHKIFYSVKKLKPNSVTVLCFHRVSNEYDFFWPPLSVNEFEKIIKYCSAKYQVISLSGLQSKENKKSKKLAGKSMQYIGCGLL